MRRVFFTLFILVFASNFAYGNDEERLKSLIKFTQVSGDFNQTKILKSFKNPLISRGVFKIYDNTFEQNTTTPFKTSIKVDKSGVFEYKNGKFVKINSNFNEELFLAIFTLDFKKLQKNFNYEISFDDGWNVSLKPVGIISKVFTKIEISGKEYVSKIRLCETNGDETLYSFFNIK
ncbi:LolA family protein [Campylobacter ureolyticus]|uniref:LolA family protein n=1 Tax=Campylobacter ureolyticus TaxID=827 RepID=UPI0022B5C39D|nr:outer membrane lipoprotein carrier protein LolA [Campylobacter ureolyticus]MCZ6104793.1 outer membrane lipoprotein carrier protein LolA [Campylobacter ureolyticus]MCZ6157409.1 outer membrane lipoprotein carrier protein LolA [Campylobacter ureolyticus]